jgi:hypothetical protein
VLAAESPEGLRNAAAGPVELAFKGIVGFQRNSNAGPVNTFEVLAISIRRQEIVMPSLAINVAGSSGTDLSRIVVELDVPWESTLSKQVWNLKLYLQRINAQ